MSNIPAYPIQQAILLPIAPSKPSETQSSSSKFSVNLKKEGVETKPKFAISLPKAAGSTNIEETQSKPKFAINLKK